MKLFAVCVIAVVECDFSMFYRNRDEIRNGKVNLDTVGENVLNAAMASERALFRFMVVNELRSDIGNMAGTGHRDGKKDPLAKAWSHRGRPQNSEPSRKTSKPKPKTGKRLRLRMFNKHHHNTGRRQ